IAVELKGKVVLVRCLMFGRTSIGLVVGNETYWLDIRGKKGFDSLMKPGQMVAVTGELDELLSTNGDPAFIVNVSNIRADDTQKADSVKKTVKVEIRGRLRLDTRDILRPYGVSWYVTVNGTDYYLDQACPRALVGELNNLDGQTVIVAGTLEVHGK